MVEIFKIYGMGAAGTLASLIYLYYSIREKVWLWPWGIIASAISIWVFFSSRLYADMGLQLYYLVISAYGWWYWSATMRAEGGNEVPIVRLEKALAAKLAVTGLLVYALILVVLLKVPVLFGWPASDMPYWDAATTAASFVATWMLARKIIEHWLIWVVVDLVSMGMYYYKARLIEGSGDLYFYSFLFLVYTIGAWWGYVQWQKLMWSEKQA